MCFTIYNISHLCVHVQVCDSKVVCVIQKPLDLFLPEGGNLTLALASLLKDMHSVGKNSILNPGHLFGQVRMHLFTQLSLNM